MMALAEAEIRSAASRWHDAGLLLVGHGSSEAPGPAVAALAQCAARLQRSRRFGAIGVGLLRGEPQAAAALAALATASVYVVPLFMSDGQPVRAALPQALGMAGRERRIRYCDPVGTHPRLAGLIARRARAECLRAGLEPADTVLLLVAHGTDRDNASAAAARDHAGRIAAAGDFAEVRTAFLDQSPHLAATLPALAGRNVVVVGLMAAEGRHGGDDIRGAIAGTAGGAGRIRYAGAIGTDPGIAGLVTDLVLARGSRRPPA
jgi:sirohydrochlorin cobaltochelatase